MTSSTGGTEYIVDQLAAISGVLKDDIHVSDDTVTTYVPTNQLEQAEQLENIEVDVLEEHEHEYLISAKASQ
ncbi:hypothetical protein AArcCO_4050 (plasmid) [Halalkaliarchaeum sp. AArc-CO]|uniref:hypothetical protein n=1 Tax=Halalkaliarchaeum sp. AArc-CO TaxID=2866381 RepID=UPI00217EC324|nr:hypothetical protein [Halalkaliarchaeum sp. AArc-CO]UWG49225.1 hypothetical protein AArcCO_4050 [Halalkaliarchaeum sp. AArc-CO]